MLYGTAHDRLNSHGSGLSLTPSVLPRTRPYRPGLSGLSSTSYTGTPWIIDPTYGLMSSAGGLLSGVYGSVIIVEPNSGAGLETLLSTSGITDGNFAISDQSTSGSFSVVTLKNPTGDTLTVTISLNPTTLRGSTSYKPSILSAVITPAPKSVSIGTGYSPVAPIVITPGTPSSASAPASLPTGATYSGKLDFTWLPDSSGTNQFYAILGGTYYGDVNMPGLSHIADLAATINANQPAWIPQASPELYAALQAVLNTQNFSSVQNFYTTLNALYPGHFPVLGSAVSSFPALDSGFGYVLLPGETTANFPGGLSGTLSDGGLSASGLGKAFPQIVSYSQITNGPAILPNPGNSIAVGIAASEQYDRWEFSVTQNAVPGESFITYIFTFRNLSKAGPYSVYSWQGASGNCCRDRRRSWPHCRAAATARHRHWRQ